MREWPELEAFGVEWVRKWLGLRERLWRLLEHCADIRGWWRW